MGFELKSNIRIKFCPNFQYDLYENFMRMFQNFFTGCERIFGSNEILSIKSANLTSLTNLIFDFYPTFIIVLNIIINKCYYIT